MAKPVKLSVHKNTKRRRRAKRVNRQIKREADEAQQQFEGGLEGFVLVTWDDVGRHKVYWTGTKSLLNCPLEDFVHNVIRRECRRIDIYDTLAPDPDDGA